MLATLIEDMMRPEIIWFLVGLGLVFCELAMPGLVIVFFGLGALVTAVSCMIFEIELNVQLIIFLVSSLAMLIMLRKSLKRVFVGQSQVDGSDLPVSKSEFVGSRATVVVNIDAKLGGKVELNGTEWKAQCGKDIVAGEVVRVVGQDNLTLIVEEI